MPLSTECPSSAEHGPRRVLRRTVGLTLAALGLVILGTAATASASHGRGTTLSASVAPDQTATIVLTERTQSTCTPGDPVYSGGVSLYSLDGPGGARALVGSYNQPGVCSRTSGSFIEARAEIPIPMGDLPDGWYVVRHEGNAKVANIINVKGGGNASATSWSSEAQFRKIGGEVTGSPAFGVDLPFAASIGYAYNQNLAVTDPDGGTASSRSMCCNADAPDYAVSTDVIQVGPGGAIADNQIVIPDSTTSTLSSGQFLEFKVQVTDDDGEFSQLDMVLSPTTNVPPDFPPPAETTISMAGGDATTIPLRAEDPDPGQSITFSLSGQPSWVTLTQTPGNPATGSINVNPPPIASGTFVVNVNAHDSDPSLQATTSYTLTFEVAGVPDQPRNLRLDQGDRQLTVTWDPPAPTGTEVTGYRVEHREAGSGALFTAAAGSTSPLVISGLDNGTLYEVRVVALSANGDGIPAVASTAPYATPGAVSDLAARPSTTSADVSWSAPSNDGGSPVTGYLVEHRPAGASTWTVLDEASTPAASLAELTRGVAHEVRVAALNAAGPGAWTTLTFRTLGLPSSGSSSVVVIRDGEPVTAPLYGGTTAAPLISVAGTPTGAGSWATTEAGHVYTAGDAQFHGSMGGARLNSPITGITPTVSGDGYYLVAEDGGVFAFGDATFHGSMGGTPLNQPVQGIVQTCTGEGYYLVALDGGVFAFGDAEFHGSMGGTALNKGMLGITPNCERAGYWTFAADGGVFTFGANTFYGSLGANPPASGVVAMTAMPDSRGYWLVAGDGTAFPFGSAIGG